MISTNQNLPLHRHDWHAVVRLTESKWQDVCVDCGAHRIVDTASVSSVPSVCEEFPNEGSGIANLDAAAAKQRVRDDWNWFSGFVSGIFWGVIAGAVAAFALAAFTH